MITRKSELLKSEVIQEITIVYFIGILGEITRKHINLSKLQKIVMLFVTFSTIVLFSSVLLFYQCSRFFFIETLTNVAVYIINVYIKFHLFIFGRHIPKTVHVFHHVPYHFILFYFLKHLYEILPPFFYISRFRKIFMFQII